MILIVKTGNGEQWEDYREIIHSVYQINRKSLTESQIQSAYNAHITKLCQNIGLVVNPHWPATIMHSSLQPEGKTPSRELKKQHKQILKDNTFLKFIEETYNAKKVEDIQECMMY
jgi:urease accessory protein UreE